MYPHAQTSTTHLPGIAAFYGSAPPLDDAPDTVAPALKDISVEQLTIRRLRAQSDIRAMARLRQEINLAAAASADPHFAEREKKETNWAWSTPSSCMAS
jgi:hypothetical protein